MTSMLNRRTALSLGVPALAVVLSACGNATSNSGSSASASGSSSSNASPSGSASSAPSGDASGSASAGERQAHPVRLRPRVTPPK